MAATWEDRFSEAALTCLEFDKRNILALIQDAKELAKARKSTINWKNMQDDVIAYLEQEGGENWRSTFIPVLSGTVNDTAGVWSAQMGMQFDVRNIEGEAWFQNYTLTFAQPINDTTSAELHALLEQGYADGWTIPMMEKRMGLMFDQWAQGDIPPEEFEWYQKRTPQWRRNLIARTETIRMFGAGTQAIFESWGILKKQWYATLDERTCPFCNKMHDKIIATQDVFLKAGERLTVETINASGAAKTQGMTSLFGDVTYPPLHVGCRCTVLPVMEQPAAH